MPKDLTQDEFVDKVEKSKGLVMVDFWAAWCAPCRALSPLLEKIGKENDKVTVYKVNVDENQQIAMKHQVQAIPTVKLFKDGEEVQTLIGLMPQSEYEKYIDQHA